MRVRNDHDYDRNWYIESGYHDWTKGMSYLDVIRSQPYHHKRLMFALRTIGYADLVREKSVLEAKGEKGNLVYGVNPPGHCPGGRGRRFDGRRFASMGDVLR